MAHLLLSCDQKWKMNFVAENIIWAFSCANFFIIAQPKNHFKKACAFYRSYVNSEIFGLMMTDLEMGRALKSRASGFNGARV